MNIVIFEDVANVFVLCALLGVGVVALVGLLFMYIAALGIMESLND